MENPVKIFALMYLIVFELLFGFMLTQVDTAKDAAVMSVFIILGFLVIVLILIMPDDE